MIKAFLVCVSFLSIFNVSYASLKKAEIQEILQSLPSDDRKTLDSFFRNILFSQGFAYTLFGDKPLSFESFDVDAPKKNKLFRTSSQGYRAWEKYVKLFPQKNFIFLFYENPDDDTYEITLINKRAFCRVVDNHREEFAKIFGSEVSPDKLLNLLIQKRSLWNTPMKDREDLIGILLGFGKSNAVLFQKRSELLRIKRGIKKKRTEPSSGYSSIDEELKVLNTSLESFSKEGKVSVYYMRLPSFVADPKDAETTQLKEKYREQRKRITRLYSRGEILEITLCQLCSQDESRSFGKDN